MLVELLNELLNEASPFYFYASWLLTVFCLYNFIDPGFYSRKNSIELMRRDYHSNQFGLLSHYAHIGLKDSILDWIITKTKRKDGPEDDDDNFSFSLNSAEPNKRGGRIWTDFLCSPALKNIVYS